MKCIFQYRRVTPRHAPHSARQAQGDYSMHKVLTAGKPEYVFQEDQLLWFASHISKEVHDQTKQYLRIFLRSLTTRRILKLLLLSLLQPSNSQHSKFASLFYEQFSDSTWSDPEPLARLGTLMAEQAMKRAA